MTNVAAALAVVVGLAALLAAPDALAQEATLSGRVVGPDAPEGLAGATVYAEAIGRGTTTDADGRYALVLPTGRLLDVRFSFVGYEPTYRTVELDGDLELSVELEAREGRVGEVAVEADAVDGVMTPISGVNRVGMDEIERLPQFLGEADVNRTLLQLPGVTSVGDGASGFNVRGGNTDQNLVLLDGSQVFFSSHLFGLVSLFNPDLVDDVTVYKGGVPARYGGRVSSVIDVRQRPGRTDRLRTSGSVSLMAARLGVEAPVLGDKVTVNAGGRVSYVNWMLGLAERADVKSSRASYADLGARVDVRPSPTASGAATAYYGRDRFRFGADTTYAYETLNLSARALLAPRPGLAVTPQLTLTDYTYGFGSGAARTGFDYDARVTHASAALDVARDLGGAQVEGGLDVDAYWTRPGSLAPTPGSVIGEVVVDRERGVETAAYVAGSVERGGLRADVGLRYSLWTALGPADVPVLDPSRSGPEAVTGFERVESGGVVARYGGLEPRVALRYALGDSSSVKLGFDRLRQYVHLVSNTTAPTPVDRWKLSDPNVRPQVGDQVSAAYARALPGGFRVSFETYYRWLHRVVDYRPGAQLLLNNTLGADLLEGRGRAYGAEVLLRRTTGDLTGWLSYALSRSERVVDDGRGGEQINFGNPYPSDFDRPHDLSLALVWQEQPRVRWGVNFVYSSGRPITFPTGAYRVGSLVVPSYTLRNQARIPAYHRLDLSVSLDHPRPPGSRFRGTWTLAVYNVYARKNAYSVFFRQEPGTAIPQPYRLSTLGAAFPSVSYVFSF